MTTSAVSFDRPIWLLLLPAAVIVVWLVKLWSRRSLSKSQSHQQLLIRLAVVTLLCFAMAGMRLHSRTNRLTTIFVLDVSDSISPDQRHAALAYINNSLRKIRPDDKVGLVEFGGEPSLVSPPSSNLDTGNFSVDVSSDSTNLEAAINAAAGAMPDESGKRIVLLTDGLENSGNARSTLQGLTGQGIQVDVAPTMLSQSARPEALVEKVVVPAYLPVRSTFPIRVVLASNVEQPATISISRDGNQIQNLSIDLHLGKNLIESADKIDTGGRHQYLVKLVPTNDTFSQNNIASATTLVQGSPHVLYLRNSNEVLPSAGSRALIAQGLDVTTMAPASAPQTVTGLANFDAIVLSDLAAGDLSPSQLTAIRSANQDFGVGLGMIGGVNSFGTGGFAGTPIEAAMPVHMLPKQRSNIPSADVVIVLDASGSMAADENGLEKVEIAARAALNLLSALKPTDRVAVLAVTETATLVMPLVSPSKSAAYVPAIEAVTAGGGGIDCRNGLEAAYTLLETSNAAIKHVIICPDTTDSEQQDGCVRLATAVYSTSRISTSVCGIGDWEDSDVPFQRSLASAGHGQLYVANQAGNLPQFFQRDVQNVEQKLFNEGDFPVLSSSMDPVIGSVPRFPDILGYNVTDPKPNAKVPLTVGSNHDPLLAYWQDGLGRSFAFTGDDSAHWAARWVSWSEFAPIFTHIVRWSMKSREDDSFQTLVSNQNGEGHIVVDAFSSSGFDTSAKFQTEIADPNNNLQKLSLSETAPGRYESTFDTRTIGDYLVQVTNLGSGGHQTETVSTSYSPEYEDLQPNFDLLDDLTNQTGGAFLTQPGQVFRRQTTWNLGSISLVQDLLLASGILFLLDVAWRRFGWRLQASTGSAAVKLAQESAEATVRKVRVQAQRSKSDTPGMSPTPKVPTNTDSLRRRTAARAELEDDDPFPYVKALPPRKRKESETTVSKDIK